MIKLGVFAAVGGVMIACASAGSAMDNAGTVGPEIRLRHDALRRGVILTKDALEAYRVASSAGTGVGPAGSLDGVPGGTFSGDPVGRTAAHGANAAVDVRPDADGPVRQRTSPGAVKASVGGFLDALANIRVKVRPAPPRDYVVTINGRPYPASERSIYAIPPGVVQISVLRKGKPPCNWAGAVGIEAEKVLDCRL
ncbi:MAG: hypothetical protein K2X54_01415 [Methylobacterium organophilum]|jgi:hypothetical protein|nr:hypothetical protein [Methylobacterium organophilum]